MSHSTCDIVTKKHDISDIEIVASILAPHFDAVRDEFASFETTDGTVLSKLKKTKFVVSKKAHDTARHFAQCREDGLLITLAPQMIDLPLENLIAIVAHEFGHAADFAYPGHWAMPEYGPGKAQWVGDVRDKKHGMKFLAMWDSRPHNQVEWAADGIAQAVLGLKITYCGDCLIQCFGGGVERPWGLK